jgi:pimeloyl-ACP methyl ester carboxylesterase
MAFASVGDVELFYTDEGDGDPPMLFVHGFSCDSHDWIWQLAHFGSSHRVIAVDLRGHGRSSVPADGFEPRVFANDIAALLEQLDCGPVVAVGHSLGGVIVSALAVEHAERVRAVVCVDPGYLIGDELASSIQPLLDALAADPVPVAQALIGRSYTDASPPELRTWHLRRLAGVPEHVLCQTIAHLNELAVRSASEPFLRRRSCPVLTVYANHERVPIETALFSDPRSQALSWDGVGHWLHQERPEAFNAVVEGWLADIGMH